MFNNIRAFGAWLARHLLGIAQMEGRITKIQVSEWDRYDIKRMIEEAQSDLEIRALIKCIHLHYKAYRYPEDKEQLMELCMRKSYQLEAKRRGEYPIPGIDVLAEIAD